MCSDFIRVEHTANYVVFDKTCINDATLSWRAKGLFAYLMGLPNDWQIRICDLVNRSTEGRDAFRTAMKELQAKGYVVRTPIRDEGGKLAGEKFTIVEVPEQSAPLNAPVIKKDVEPTKRRAKTAVIVPPRINTPEFLEVFEQWKTFRLEMKKPTTPTSENMALKKLGEYSSAKAVLILEACIRNGWRGIYVSDDIKKDSPKVTSSVMEMF